MKKLYILSFLLTACFSLQKTLAIPATPEPSVIKQSDGTELTVFLRGDEYFNFYTTDDNLVIIKNETGTFVYAEQDVDGHFTPSKIVAHNRFQRTKNEQHFVSSFSQDILKASKMRANMERPTYAPQKATPFKGSTKILCILVNFTNRSFVSPTAHDDFNKMMNEEGYSGNGCKGSVRDYFIASSDSVFMPQIDVVGPVDLPESSMFYADLGAKAMMLDACRAVDTSINFKDYDSDKNGIVDGIFVYFAGYNAAEKGGDTTIWPVQSIFSSSYKFDGISLGKVACGSELKGNSGEKMTGLGTFTHEFSHVLGLPDYYCTLSNCKVNTVRSWSLMDYGCYNDSSRTPPLYSAYDRFHVGWYNPVFFPDTGDYELKPLHTGDKGYVLSFEETNKLPDVGKPVLNPIELFFFENRQKKGWDAFLPGEGLLIWHLYYFSPNWYQYPNNFSPIGMTVVRADSTNTYTAEDLAGDPFPGTHNVTSFSPSWYAYGTEDLFTNIEVLADSNIRFHYWRKIIAPDPVKNTDIHSDDYVLWPNPVNDYLYIQQKSNNKITDIRVFDIYGRTVLRPQHQNQDSEILVDLSNYQAGIYFIRIETASGFFGHKIIKK